MDGLDGTGLQLDGLDWFKTFIGDQKLKKILYRQLEKVIFPAVTMRLTLRFNAKVSQVVCTYSIGLLVRSDGKTTVKGDA